jgi:hypothetical protein
MYKRGESYCHIAEQLPPNRKEEQPYEKALFLRSMSSLILIATSSTVSVVLLKILLFLSFHKFQKV